MCCNYNDSIELNKLAQKNKIILFENFQFRFHEQFKFIQSLIKDNFVGDIRYIRSAFCFPPFKDRKNIRYQANLGGGALLDAGVYPIKISQLLLGLDLEVQSTSLYYDDDLGVDIWGGAFMKKKNSNVFSQIAFGFDNFYQCNIEILGNKGKIFTDRIFTAPNDYEPTIFIENHKGKKDIKVNAQNHFDNMLLYFHSLIISKKNINYEYLSNINQSYLLDNIRLKIQNDK